MNNQSAIIGYVRSGATVEEIGNIMLMPDKDIIKTIKNYVYETGTSNVIDSPNMRGIIPILRPRYRSVSVRKKTEKVLPKKVGGQV